MTAVWYWVVFAVAVFYAAFFAWLWWASRHAPIIEEDEPFVVRKRA